MQPISFRSLVVFFLAFCSLHSGLLLGIAWPWSPCNDANICCFGRPGANQLYIGPEIYHVQRMRDGGAKQLGWVYGVRAGYEHIKRCKFYWGGDALYGKGTLSGRSASEDELKSKFIDKSIEGRFGYTFQRKTGYKFAFTPFIGIGYAEECNNFISPSPLRVHFKLRFSYGVVGFLSKMSWSPCLDIGVNFKAKFLYDAKNCVSHDPDIDGLRMLVKNQTHYRVELPMTYRKSENFFLSLVPFYEFRHYGGQVNFPFDFLETKLNIYGVTFKFLYCL